MKKTIIVVGAAVAGIAAMAAFFNHAKVTIEPEDLEFSELEAEDELFFGQ